MSTTTDTSIPALNPGDRVKLAYDQAQRWWTVRTTDDRYTVLTRQAEFQPKGTLRYTIIDRVRALRGPCNLIGQGYDVEAPGGCERLLAELQSGEVEISYRNNVRVKITALEENKNA